MSWLKPISESGAETSADEAANLTTEANNITSEHGKRLAHIPSIRSSYILST